MDRIVEMLQGQVDAGLLPGAVAMVGSVDDPEVIVVGVQDLESRTPMSTTSLFHWDSLGKPLTAALALTAVADGTLDLDSPIERWLPELAAPVVLGEPGGQLRHTVPARRPVTVEDLLTLRGGLGFTSDFESPFVTALVDKLQEGPSPRTLTRDSFLSAAGSLPLAHQPGSGWTYNTGSTLLGLLLERATATPLDELMTERLFDPLGMRDARWWVQEGDAHRFTSRYGTTGDPDRPLELVDPPTGHYSRPPAFPDGAGGVIGTVHDWFAFGAMLLGDGCYQGRQLLPVGLVQAMMTDQLTPEQRRSAKPFLADGEGWGYGGSVRDDGTYGWTGGAGTSARVDPLRERVAILFTQVAVDGPQGSPVIDAFDRLAHVA